MKLFSVILTLFCALALWGDAVIVIKGKARRSSIKVEERAGLPARVKRYNSATEIGLRPRKKFQTAKLTFSVLNDDEYTFTLGGGYTRTDGDRKDVFEWIDCTLFRVNGKELIGPKVEKGGKKSETLARPKPIKGGVKLKKNDKLTIEITLRATPKKDARKREAEGSMTQRQKERAKREEAKEKARAEEKARLQKEREATAAANRRVLEKRYGIKRTAENGSSGKQSTPSAPAAAPGNEDPEDGNGDGE